MKLESPKLLSIRTDAREYCRTSQLIICPIGAEYTVGHAVQDFCDVRRQISSEKSLHATISLVNTYIIPQLSGISCESLTLQHCRSLLQHVESSFVSRRGGTSLVNADPETLDPETRRRRRITANNAYTEFRTALTLAYADGKIANNNSWRRVRIFRTVYRAPPEFKQLILGAL